VGTLRYLLGGERVYPLEIPTGCGHFKQSHRKLGQTNHFPMPRTLLFGQLTTVGNHVPFFAFGKLPPMSWEDFHERPQQWTFAVLSQARPDLTQLQLEPCPVVAVALTPAGHFSIGWVGYPTMPVLVRGDQHTRVGGRPF